MTTKNPALSRTLRIAAFACAAATLAACATAPTPSAIQGPEQIFATPDQAVDTYIAAVRADDKAQLLKILGPNADKIISSGDTVADKNGRDRFLAAYDAAHEISAVNDDEDILVIGAEQWPLPIPLVRTPTGWHWDTEAGEEEILNRRVGRNELNVINICRAYVEAQREYAATHHTPDGAPLYAQKFVSARGKHDGLYWPARDGEPESPLGPLVAAARAEGYTKLGKHDAPTPYHGYYYKILTQQGPDAAGGAKNYLAHGHMTGGFALLAFPATYGDSGVMSFIVNHNGIVYEKNLGPDTAAIAARMTVYDPDSSWGVNGSLN